MIMINTSTEAFAQAAAETVRIVRILTVSGETMRYGVWLRLIGAIPADGPWQMSYRTLCRPYAEAAAALATLRGQTIAREPGQPGLEFWRFVNQTGETGEGIVRDLPWEKDSEAA
jgi:hypothetical protein